MYNMDYKDLTVDKSEHLCEVHPDGIEKAETLCINCNKKMCNCCNKYHQAFFKDHEITHLNNTPGFVECKHTDQMEVYCTKCDTPLCLLCESKAHRGHWTESINNVVEETKNIYEEIKKTCTDEYVGRLKQRSKNHREECEQTKQHISDFVERQKTTLDRKKEEMFKQSEMIACKKKIVSEQQLNLYTRQRDVLEQVPRLLKLSHSPQLTWIAQRNLLQSTLHTTEHQQIRMKEEEDDDKIEEYIFSPNNEIEKYLDAISLGCFEKLPDNMYDDAKRDGDYTYSYSDSIGPSGPYLNIINPVQQTTQEPTPVNETATCPDQFYDQALEQSEIAVDCSTGTCAKRTASRNSHNVPDKGKPLLHGIGLSNIGEEHAEGDSPPNIPPRPGQKEVNKVKLNKDYVLDETELDKLYLDDPHIYDEPDEPSGFSFGKRLTTRKPPPTLSGPSTLSRKN